MLLDKRLFGLGLELALDHHKVLRLELLLVGGAGVLVHLALPAAKLLSVLPSFHHRLHPGLLVVPTLLVDHLDVGQVDQLLTAHAGHRVLVLLSRSRLGRTLARLLALFKGLHLFLQLGCVDFSEMKSCL